MRAVAVIAALGLGLSLPGWASSNSALVKLDERHDLLGWEAVGRVEIAGQGYCTGVLIATNLVLTAAHCVYDRTSGQRHESKEMRFQAGWRHGTAIAERRVARVAVHPGYVHSHGLTAGQVSVDAALLKLDNPIPAAMAAPFALQGEVRAGARVSVISYGLGRSNALSWQRDCGLLGQGQGLMAFDCDVTFGSSGAPVFTQQGQRARILSLVSSGGTRDGAPISFGMKLPAVMIELKRVLRQADPEHRNSAGPSTGARRVRIGEGQVSDDRSGIGARFVRPPG